MDILSFFDRKEYTKCITCGRLIRTSEFSEVYGRYGICKSCSIHLPIIPVGTVFETKDEYISYCISAFFYRSPVRELIWDYKFRSCTAYGGVFSAYMYTYLMPFLQEGYSYDMVVPVPLSEERMKERGYNQAEILSDDLAKRINAEHSTSALKRIRATKRQSDLPVWERIKNTENAFASDNSIVGGKSILLIDDMYTTGNTVKECAKALINNGASQVCVYTLARQPGIRRSKEYNELLTK